MLRTKQGWFSSSRGAIERVKNLQRQLNENETQTVNSTQAIINFLRQAVQTQPQPAEIVPVVGAAVLHLQ